MSKYKVCNIYDDCKSYLGYPPYTSYNKNYNNPEYLKLIQDQYGEKRVCDMIDRLKMADEVRKGFYDMSRTI